MKYNTIIFDLDGTLLDTMEDLTDSVNFALSKHGLPQKKVSETVHYVGNGVGRLVELSLDGGRENPLFADVLGEFRKHYSVNCCNKTRPYPGITEMLSAVKEKGIGTAVISNKYDAAVKEICRRYFGGLISFTAGERQGVPRKPAPDMIYRVLAELGAEKSGTVFVGDSDVDFKTSVNAGMDCVSVLWGFRSRAELEAAGASRFISAPAELLGVL